MDNFTFHNPVRLVFGKGQIAKLSKLIPAGAKVLLAYGGGSIKRNGVYEQVTEALKGHEVVEFGGIEPNPKYETLLRAIDLVKRERVEFLLAVGGGSVLDGVKFVAAASLFKGEDPWDIVGKQVRVDAALPIGCVLTLPATGSEMNGNSVVTRVSTQEKLSFHSPHVYPQFSILDPETTYSLPARQVTNGIVDAFVHVMEQYMTFPAGGAVQDRMAEGVLASLVEVGPRALAEPTNYDVRASLMWAATIGLNGILGVGMPQDWASHGIGHELTALYGLDHGQTLAVVLPAVWRYKRETKAAKLLQYGERVLGIREGSEQERVDAAIDRTEAFFQSVGAKTRLDQYGVTEGLERVPERLAARGARLGEHNDIGPDEVRAILALCAK